MHLPGLKLSSYDGDCDVTEVTKTSNRQKCVICCSSRKVYHLCIFKCQIVYL